MKTVIHVLIASFSLAITGMANTSYAATVGLGAAIGGDSSALALPIRTQQFIFQPELTHYYSNYKSDSRRFENEQISMGVFGYKPSPIADNMEILWGVGVGYSRRDSKSTHSWGKYDEEGDAIFIAPAIGFNYYVNDKVSIGVEARYYFEDGDGKSENVQSDGEDLIQFTETDQYKTSYSNTRVSLRYYFGGV